MFDFLWKYWRFIIPAALIAVAIDIAMVQHKDEDDYNLIDRGLVKVTSPVQLLIGRVLDRAQDGWHRYLENVHAAQQNEALRSELSEMRRQLIHAEEVQRENHRLLALLGLIDRSKDVRYQSARVIAYSTSALFKSLRIDRGSADGLSKGMGVVVDTGIVGRLLAVDTHYSDVILLIDGASSIDVIVGRTRARGRLRGVGDVDGYRARIEYLVRSANVEKGDEILTTGAGVVFPKGLLVGYVTDVNKVEHGLYQEVVVEPAAPLRRLDEVLVVVGFGPGATIEPQKIIPAEDEASSESSAEEDAPDVILP